MIAPSRWLIGVFAVVALLVLAGGAWLYRSQEQHLRQEADGTLQAVAQLKVQQIRQWRAERVADAAMIVAHPALTREIVQWLGDPKPEGAEGIRAQLAALKQLQTDDVILLDAGGKVCASASGRAGPPHPDTIALVGQALAQKRAVLSDLHVDPDDTRPHVDVVAPLPAGAEGVRGAVCLRCNAEGWLYPLVESWPMPTASAESLLVRRDGDTVLFLTNLRHRKDTALKMRIPLGRQDVPAVMAVSGRTGVVEGTDYRGVAVLSALAPVPDSPWFLVAKIDQSEAMAVWRTRALLIGGVILGLLAALATGTAFLWQRQRKLHYRDLYQAEADRRKSEERYRVTLLSIGDGVVVTDGQGRVELLNPVAEKLMGVGQAEARGQVLTDVFNIINEDSRVTVENPVTRVLREGVVVGLANHTLLVSRDGSECPIADSGAPIRDAAGDVSGVVLVFQDQTAQRHSRQKLEKLARALRTISDCNQVLVRMTDEGALLRELCRLIHAQGGYPLAWVTLEAEGRWRTAAWAGAAGVDPPEEAGPVTTALASGAPCMVQELGGDAAWAAGRGIRAAASFPLLAAGKAFGALTFCSATAGVFDADETVLLQELAGDLAYGITALRTTAALQASEQRYRSLFDHMLNGFAHCRMVREGGRPVDFVYLHVNDAFGALTGLRDVAGKPVSEVIPGFQKDNGDLLATYGRVAATGVAARFESFVPELDAWFSISAFGLGADEFVAVFEMITERKRAEEAMLASETRYRQLFEEMLVGHALHEIVCDAAGKPCDYRFLAVNPAFEAMTGLHAGDIVGRTVREVIPGIEPEWIDLYGQVALTGKHARFRQGAGGLGKVFDVSAFSPARGQFAVTFSDVTAQVRAEEALRASEAKYRSLFKEMLAGVAVHEIVCDAQGRPVDYITLEANQAFEAILGASRAAVIGKKASDLLPPEELRQWLDIFGPVALTGAARHYELHSPTTGKHFEGAAYSPARGQFAVTFTDVTERRRAERDREATVEMLRICNQAHTLPALMHDLAECFGRFTGCEAIGVRLRDGEDFPYYHAQGFSPEFVRAENHLCARDQAGELLRDSAGNPVMECMCGNILCGRFDPAKPFFTTFGSFWSSGTTELLASTTEADREARTRNRCNGEGYESVALVPIRAHGQTLGLFQLNSKEQGRFTRETIGLLERLVDYVGMAMAKLQADEALRTSERRLRLAQEAAQSGTWEWNLRTNENIWSDELWRLYGLDPRVSAATYENWVASILPEDRDQATRAVQQAADAGAELAAEWRVRDADGTIRWLMSRGQPQRDAEGNVVGYLGIVLDITGRKRAEEALRESRERLDLALRSAGMGAWRFDVRENARQFDSQVCRHLGIDAARFAGTAEEFYAAVHPKDRERLKAALAHAVATGAFYAVEYRTVWPDGSVHHIASRGQLARDAAGQPARFDGLLWDVTERKRAEEGLRESEARFRALFEYALDAMFLSAPDGRILAANPAACALFGWTQEELCRLGRQALMNPDEPRYAAALAERQRTGHVLAELTWVRKDGSIFPAEVQSVILPDEQNQTFVILRDITARRQAEEALRASEEKFRAIASHTPDHILIQDRQLCYTLVLNPQLGLTEGDMLGKTDADILAPAEAETLTAIKRTVLETGRPYKLETSLVNHQGQTEHFDGVYVPTHDAEGRTDGLIGYFRNITERKQTEEALRQSVRFARGTLDGLSAHIAIIREDGTIEAVNQAWRDFVADSPVAGHVAVGANYLLTCDQAQGCEYVVAQEFAAAVRDVLAGRRDSYEMEYPSHAPGQQRWFVGRITRFPGEGPPRAVVAHTDITQRRQAEDALQASEARLQRLMDSAPVAISISREGKTLYVNHKFLTVFGCRSAEELIGQPILNHWAPESRAMVLEYARRRIQREPVPAEYEATALRADGSQFPAHVIVERVELPDGPAFMAFLTDLTQRQQTEEQLARHQSQIAHLSRVSTMGQLASGLAHELNQPLMAIRNYAHYCKSIVENPRGTGVPLPEALAAIDQQASRAGEIIQRLRSFVQNQPPRQSAASVNELIEECLGLMAPALRHAQVRAQTHLAPDLPAVQVDLVQMEQVLVNLVQNAVEAMEQTPLESRIVALGTYLASDGRSLCLAVSDAGCGVPADQMDLIFKEFHTTKPGGLGFGLAISRRIVESHGGRLAARCNADGGMTFEIMLPCEKEA